MIEGISLTLALLAFAGFLWIYHKHTKANRRIIGLRKKVQAAEAIVAACTKQLELLKAFDERLNQIHTLSEANASKLTHLQLGKR